MPKVVAEYREQAKRRIVDVAQQAFSEKGYHETTMEDVAKMLGVSKGALYLYFRSKEELFKAIIENWERTIREILLSSFEDGKLIDGLADVLDHVLTDRKENIGLSFEFISEASRDASIRKILKENYEKNLKTLTAFLEKKKAKGTSGDKWDARSRSAALIALLIGLMGSLILGDEKTEVRRTWMKSTRAILAECSKTFHGSPNVTKKSLTEQS
nr:TetR/AcrR family transcriptional regulator [Candidatus Njordarchaeota archaeon]